MSKRDRSSQIRRLVQQAAINTTGEVLPRGASPELTGAQTQAERAAANGISIRTQGKLDYLARYHCDLLVQVRAGQMSVDRAYKQARGTKKLSALDRVKRVWKRATVTDQREIADWVFRTHRNEMRQPIRKRP